MGQNGHEMVEDAGQFAEQGADVLGAVGDLDVEQLLDSKGKALLVGHHGDVVETVKVRESLQIRLVFDELLGTTVQQADVGVCADNFLAVDLEDKTQDTVGGGMLGTKVDGVVADLAAFGRVLVARLFQGRRRRVPAGEAVDVAHGAEVLVGGDQSGARGLGGRISAGRGRRERAGSDVERTGCADPAGAGAGESVEGDHGGQGQGRRGYQTKLINQTMRTSCSRGMSAWCKQRRRTPVN